MKALPHPDSGIKIPTDLKNKKIGLSRKTQAEFFVGEFLTLNGIALDEVEIIDYAPQQVKNALINKVVDVIAHWEPFIYRLITHYGENTVYWPLQDNQPFYWVLATTDEYLLGNSDAIEKLVGALFQAENYWHQNPNEARQAIMKAYDISGEYADYIFPKLSVEISLPQELLLVLENQTRWMIKNDLVEIAAVPNYLDQIYIDALNAIKPEAVTIIK